MNNKLVVFDLDGTLTTENTWFLLNKILGLTDEDDKRLFNEYLSEKITYEKWIESIVEIYKNSNTSVSKNQIEQLANSMLLREGAFEVIQKIKNIGYQVIILSGATNIFAEKISERLNIDTSISASNLIFDENDILIDIKSRGDERNAKMQLLKEYCEENNYSIDSIISIGDGGNDLEIFKNTKGIVIGENKELNQIAWKKISTLSEIPKLIQ